MSSIDRPLSGDVLRFHLEEERTRVNDPPLLEGHGRNARTLAKVGPLRVTLVMVGAGGHMATHRSDGPISVQVLDGDIRFRLAGGEQRLVAGDLLILNAGVEHEVHSDGGGTFLLTLVHTERTDPRPAAGR
jgi:quercetin dioxygenase-like cupin family protein